MRSRVATVERGEVRAFWRQWSRWRRDMNRQYLINRILARFSDDEWDRAIRRVSRLETDGFSRLMKGEVKLGTLSRAFYQAYVVKQG